MAGTQSGNSTTHEIIIPQEHLDIVFQRVKGNHKFRPSGLLSNHLTCSYCGCSIIYDPKEKLLKTTKEIKKYHFYHCSDGKGLHRANGMKQVNVSQQDILNQYEGALESFSISPKLAEHLNKELREINNNHHQYLDSKIKRYQQQIQASDQAIDNLVDLLIAKTIDEEIYKRKIDAINEEKSKLQNELQKLQQVSLDKFNFNLNPSSTPYEILQLFNIVAHSGPLSSHLKR